MADPAPPATVPSSPVRRIALATDLSPGSTLALQRTLVLARHWQAALTLLHVVPDAPWDDLARRLAAVGGAEAPSAERVQHDAARALEALAQRAAATLGAPCATRVSVGRPAAEIARLAAETQADLLVVGAHGAHPVRDLLLGTTVQRLLRVSACPVLVVRHAAAAPYARVLAPTDFSAGARAALRYAAALLPAATLHVAHAFEVPYDGLMRYAVVDDHAVAHYHAAARERLLAELADWADAAGVSPARRKLLVAHGYAPTRIRDWAGGLPADLVVIAAHGKSPLEASFLGSVSLHAALTAPCDVLLPRGAAVGADRAA